MGKIDTKTTILKILFLMMQILSLLYILFLSTIFIKNYKIFTDYESES